MKKETKLVQSDIDPYGEENWEENSEQTEKYSKWKCPICEGHHVMDSLGWFVCKDCGIVF